MSPVTSFHCCTLLCKTLATQEPEGRRSRRKMKVIAAYLLAVLGQHLPFRGGFEGYSWICYNVNQILVEYFRGSVRFKLVVQKVGAEADDDRIELLLAEVKGKDITELIASGREKLASVPSGGGAAVAVAAPGGGGAAAPAAAEPKKEEKVEEKEESDDDMGFSLFD
ncbi:hypothetical protein AAG906_025737 [Vitis piasezkii]